MRLKRRILAFMMCLFVVISGLNVTPTTVKAAASKFAGTHFADEFNTYDTSKWHKAVDYTNGDMFYCTWRDANVGFNNGVMEMKINSDDWQSEYSRYSGGEYRTNETFGYGMYQVNMKPIKNDGVVSSFFTYTGKSDGTNWDEIDIEFLGKDTTKVQFNYYTDGVGHHEKLYDLGFDASQAYHTYGFYWARDYIAWYVDGNEVYRTPASDAGIIPNEASRIMMNVWPGKGVDDWLNPYNGNTPLTAYYDWMAWDAEGTSGNTGNENSNGGSNSTVSSATHLGLDLDEHVDTMEKSDGWSNGSMFNCDWSANNIWFEDGKMNMKIDEGGSKTPYTGGEYRTKEFYGYGYYQVKMKPIKNSGVVSSFFTYTGPTDENIWDEIDIEFLGKDTTKVQFNYFSDGVGEHEKIYDLGFDASEAYHIYGFNWQKGKITWYVDGKAVYTVESSDVPVTPGKIMMNVWPGTGVNDWLGAYDGKTPLVASYDWVAYDAVTGDVADTNNGDDSTGTEDTRTGVKEVAIEAEAFELSGNAEIVDVSEASNGYHVGNLGDGKGAASLKVNADTAGSCTLSIYYTTAEERKLNVQVNGNVVSTLKCNGNSWETPNATPATTAIVLKEGENTITFTGADGAYAPNVDRIVIELTDAEAKNVVAELIKNLPEEVTEANKAVVYATKDAYDNLTDKTGVEGADVLEKAVEKADALSDSESPVDPDDPGTPSNPGEPSNPSDQESPSDPSNPSSPSDPSNSSAPSDPSSSSDPSTPSSPSDPDSPSAPSNPSSPSEPDAPSNPSSPSEPGTPSNPSNPSSPSEPSASSNPSSPSEPSAPSNPSSPSESSAPSNPSSPSEPSAPSEPASAGNSTNPGDNSQNAGTGNTQTPSPMGEIPVKGTILEDSATGAEYKVLATDANAATVEYVSVTNKASTSAVVPDTITVGNVKYKVTSIGANAFAGCKNLKKVTIGKNVNKIGKKAFFGCKKLKNIIIKTSKLTDKKIGAKAFAGTYKKVTVKVPKKMLKSYKKILVKKGIDKKSGRIVK